MGEQAIKKEQILIKRTDNEIKETILKFLYNQYKKNRNIKISLDRAKKELKNLGLQENEIISNLENLIENNWIIKEEEEYSIFKIAERIKIKVTYLKIGEKTIKHFEKQPTPNTQ